MIVQDQKSEDFYIEFPLTLHGSVDLYNCLYGDCHTVSILSISNVKCCSATLDFACKKWKIHPVGCDKE